MVCRIVYKQTNLKVAENIPLAERGALPLNLAAIYLGVSRQTVWRLTRDGALAGVHIGRRHMIAVKELDRFLAAAATPLGEAV